MSNYDKIVEAAVNETRSKFALAEALATDIPPRKRGPTDEGELEVNAHLAAARTAVIDAGGEVRSIETMADYRKTALWVSGGTPRNFRWVPKFSFTAHDEARRSGLSYEAFAADPKNSRKQRAEHNKAFPGTGIKDMTTDQKVAVVKKVLEEEPEVVKGVVEDPNLSHKVKKAIDDKNEELARKAEKRTKRIKETDPVHQRTDGMSALIELDDFVNLYWKATKAFTVSVEGLFPRLPVLSEDSELFFMRNSLKEAQEGHEAAAGMLSQIAEYFDRGKTDLDEFLGEVLSGKAN